MTTKRTEQKRENRAKLLDAARKVFAEKGLAAATARDIVRETDLATGTFYNYFTDKEDAFRAVMDEFTALARVGAREERRKPGVNLEERVFNAYCGFFQLVAEDPEMFEIFRKNADAIAMLGAGDLFEGAVRELAEDMRQWVREGQLPPEVEPWLIATAHSMAGGGFQLAGHMLEEGASDVDATARFCTRLLLDGLRGLG
jgi:AcrR family transcriptional regulator